MIALSDPIFIGRVKSYELDERIHQVPTSKRESWLTGKYQGTGSTVSPKFESVSAFKGIFCVSSFEIMTYEEF